MINFEANIYYFKNIMYQYCALLFAASLRVHPAVAEFSVDDLIRQLQDPTPPPTEPPPTSLPTVQTQPPTARPPTAIPSNRSVAIAEGEAHRDANAALNPQHPFRKASKPKPSTPPSPPKLPPAFVAPFRREAVVVAEEELEYDPESGADYTVRPKPPKHEPPAASLLSLPCTIVNWPGTDRTGGPRCLDHFGSRLPIHSTIATPAESAWSCARWRVDLPAIRSGKRSRLCLTRVDSAWPDDGASQTAGMRGGDGLGVVARPCTSPLSHAQRWRSTKISGGSSKALAFHPAMRRKSEAFDPELCLTAHADPCRPLMSTSAELAPCSANASTAQSWMLAVSGGESQGRGDIHTRVAQRLVRNPRLGALLERCRVEDDHALDAVARRRHDGAIKIIANAANPAFPRLLVDGLHRLCLQPMVRLSGVIEVGLHRCNGIGFDPHRLLPSHHKWHGIGAAVRWVYEVTNAASVYGRFVLANVTRDVRGQRGGVQETLCLTCIACTRENLRRAHNSADDQTTRGRPQQQRAALTVASCSLDPMETTQLWEYDLGSRPRSHHLNSADLLVSTWVGAHSLRPQAAREWCVTAPEASIEPHGESAVLARCRCAEPRQRWGALRQQIETHVPSASRTEAVQDETLSRFGKHTRRIDALIAHIVPRKWLAFRDFGDIYEPVPVPYLEWLARGARAAAVAPPSGNARAAAHVDMFTIASTQRNATRRFRQVFVMALFIPHPVLSSNEDHFGPTVEVDLKYSSFAATLAELFETGEVEELRKSKFYLRYVAPMITCVRFIQKRLPQWGVRIYLAPELASIAPDILAVGNVEVALMKAPSIRTAGTFWRWLAFDDPSLDFVVAIDSDEADGASGGTVLGGLWRAVMDWKTEGAAAGHAIMRWYTGWTAGVRAENAHGVQYSPIQANVVMCKPQLLTWSVTDSIIGFGLARLHNVWERRFYPHGATRSHMFSRIFDHDPVALNRAGSIDQLWAANLGWVVGNFPPPTFQCSFDLYLCVVIYYVLIIILQVGATLVGVRFR